MDEQRGAAHAVRRARGGGLHVVAKAGERLVDVLDVLAPMAGLHLLHGQARAHGQQVAHQPSLVLVGCGIHSVSVGSLFVGEQDSTKSPACL
jgi:hypothetical protein